MNSRKLSGLTLAVFASIVLVALTLILRDGNPFPPLPPKPPAQFTLVADGNPFPPLPPKPPTQSTLVADGTPIPPLPPPKLPTIQFHG